MELTIIYSRSSNGCIDSENVLFQSDVDRKYFYKQTTYSPSMLLNAIIVGRKTWDSLPDNMRNCKFRHYYVVSTQDINAGAFTGNFRSCLENIYKNKNLYWKIFVIGGAEIYNLALNSNIVTEVMETIYCDIIPDPQKSTIFTFDPKKSDYNLKSTNKIDNLIFNYYVKNTKPFETQYLQLVNEINTFGTKKIARNDTTLSITDRSIKINLEDGFPLLTIKPVYWRGVVEEAMWMLRGSTNVKELRKTGVKIWDGNSTREFLDKQELNHLEEDDIGPGYGFQFRHSGAKYIDCKTDYTGLGVDQLQNCINLIKNNPNDRRIIIELWNPSQLKEMALPPCHKTYQFTVTNNKLSCHLYQRSWDIMLGWNTSTAALFTHILAHYCGLAVGTLTHTICDIHIYNSHMTGEFDKLLTRLPYELPTLIIKNDIPLDITEYTYDNFVLNNYKKHDKVDMKMVV